MKMVKKKKKKTTNGVKVIQQSHCWAYMQKNSNSKKYMQPNVHRSTTYNNQMDKEDVEYVYVCMYIYPVLCLVTQSFPTIWDTMDCSPPGSSVHGILQARILEYVAMLSSRESS